MDIASEFVITAWLLKVIHVASLHMNQNAEWWTGNETMKIASSTKIVKRPWSQLLYELCQQPLFGVNKPHLSLLITHLNMGTMLSGFKFQKKNFEHVVRSLHSTVVDDIWLLCDHSVALSSCTVKRESGFSVLQVMKS